MRSFLLTGKQGSSGSRGSRRGRTTTVVLERPAPGSGFGLALKSDGDVPQCKHYVLNVLEAGPSSEHLIVGDQVCIHNVYGVA